jgi:intracellular septation protein A
MEKLSNNNSNEKQSILKIILNRDFVVSAIIPIIIVTLFNKYNMIFDGIVICGLWCIGVVLINFIKERKINALAAMAGTFSAVGLIGTIISKNPTFYLVSPIVQDILCALLFFGSLFFERSLLQIIVEQSYLKNVPEDFKRTEKYKSAWRILTCAWGILNLSQAALRAILLHSVSMGSYYAISTVYSNVSVPVLIAISITFPKWYWNREK